MLNRLEMLRLFVAAAEAKSFKEAALRLHVSPQAVTRAVQELEEHLGELLFHRNTRANRITDFGAVTIKSLALVNNPNQPDLTVPGPGAAALMGLAGLVGLRRRR